LKNLTCPKGHPLLEGEVWWIKEILISFTIFGDARHRQ